MKVPFIVGVGWLSVIVMTATAALGQSSSSTTQSVSSRSVNLGDRDWSGPVARHVTPDGENQLEFEIRGGVVSDYTYRGVTLSDRKPSVGAAIEAAYALFYAGATVASVRLPTRPDAEISVSGGIRPTLGKLNFDLGVSYFRYPGEDPATESKGIDYWEGAIRVGTNLSESVQIVGGYAYSPNVSNTGAWSHYVAGGVGYEIPSQFLPAGVSASFTAAVGYSWFGRMSPDLGGFPLPAYLNWQAGVTFSRERVNLDLRYHDTNLSKENCFVFTGDPNARPGGAANPLTNPDGLTSRWCGAAFVAKLWFVLN